MKRGKGKRTVRLSAVAVTGGRLVAVVADNAASDVVGAVAVDLVSIAVAVSDGGRKDVGEDAVAGVARADGEGVVGLRAGSSGNEASNGEDGEEGREKGWSGV
jgi:hypothetical protein